MLRVDKVLRFVMLSRPVEKQVKPFVATKLRFYVKALC